MANTKVTHCRNCEARLTVVSWEVSDTELCEECEAAKWDEMAENYEDEEDDEMKNQTVYRVWCEVWGGVTGSRQSWLRSNGQIVEFDSMESAEQEANRLNEAMGPMGISSQRASFRYSAREYTRY